MTAPTHVVPVGGQMSGMPIEKVNAGVAGVGRFTALWERRVASPPSRAADVVFADLGALYGAPYRKFHNLCHIQDCLCRFDESAPYLVDPDAVEFALWFHDAVYECGATTNEARSAEMFLELSAGAAFGFRHRVCSLIMATRHRRRVSDNDKRFIVDIDLSGFGAPWEEFMRNGQLLREESGRQNEHEYQTGQLNFLGRLQRRPTVFSTDYFRDKYEATARANLSRVLAELAAKGYATPSRRPRRHEAV